MKPGLSCSCAAALVFVLAPASGATALQWPKDRTLPQAVEPGEVEPWRPAVDFRADPAETGSLFVKPAGPTLADWYARQGRPAMILFFDRRLERLPPGWNGTVRMKIAHESTAAGKTETEQVTLGMERQAPVRSVRKRTPVAQLLENALAQELHRMRLRLVDPTFAERALASKGKGGDTEFDSIKGAARYVFEVELAATGEAVWMVGELKSVGGGEIVATVRQPVEHDLHDPGDADALARAFVKRLLESPAVDP